LRSHKRCKHFLNPVRQHRCASLPQPACSNNQWFWKYAAQLQIVSQPSAPRLPPSDVGYDVAFRNVHFKYRPDAPILRGVTFDVPAGTSCALVGTSGSGKSTLLRLMFRFYDASEGSVRIGGRDVREWDLPSLRAPMGSVPQARRPPQCHHWLAGCCPGSQTYPACAKPTSNSHVIRTIS
jgi:ABC-type transport system involved in Fe-S cluster assembly fused permease/ATPase subunit